MQNIRRRRNERDFYLEREGRLYFIGNSRNVTDIEIYYQRELNCRVGIVETLEENESINPIETVNLIKTLEENISLGFYPPIEISLVILDKCTDTAISFQIDYEVLEIEEEAYSINFGQVEMLDYGILGIKHNIYNISMCRIGEEVTGKLVRDEVDNSVKFKAIKKKL